MWRVRASVSSKPGQTRLFWIVVARHPLAPLWHCAAFATHSCGGDARGHSEVNEHCGKQIKKKKLIKTTGSITKQRVACRECNYITIVYTNNSICIWCACYDRRRVQIARAVNRIKAHWRQRCAGSIHQQFLIFTKKTVLGVVGGKNVMDKYFEET